jgi:hypothetical protein
MGAPQLQLTFDANDPTALAGFWAKVVGYKFQDPPEGYDTWQQFFDANGIVVEENQASAIVDPDGIRPRFFFQRVPESKSAKNRIHLDVNVVGRRDIPSEERLRLLEVEAERLTRLGATKSRVFNEHDELWIVMLDPEGNEFCIQ